MSKVVQVASLLYSLYISPLKGFIPELKGVKILIKVQIQVQIIYQSSFLDLGKQFF